MNKVVTISRQYASGGREVAEKLAKEYGVPFYDRALIAKAQSPLFHSDGNECLRKS